MSTKIKVIFNKNLKFVLGDKTIAARAGKACALNKKDFIEIMKKIGHQSDLFSIVDERSYEYTILSKTLNETIVLKEKICDQATAEYSFNEMRIIVEFINNNNNIDVKKYLSDIHDIKKTIPGEITEIKQPEPSNVAKKQVKIKTNKKEQQYELPWLIKP